MPRTTLSALLLALGFLLDKISVLTLAVRSSLVFFPVLLSDFFVVGLSR